MPPEWLTRKDFAAQYQKRWKLEKPPSKQTLHRWFTKIFAPNKLAKLVANPFVASGTQWLISPQALEIEKPKLGPPFAKKKKNAKTGAGK